MSAVYAIIGALAFGVAVSIVVSVWRCRASRGGHVQLTAHTLTPYELRDRLNTESRIKRRTGRHHISTDETRLLSGDAADLFGGYPLGAARSASISHGDRSASVVPALLQLIEPDR
jgi:hypothetical protein